MSTDSKFLEQLEAGLDRAQVSDGATLIVAFSGGPDSSALLAGLAHIGNRRDFDLIAVHVNHQIRLESSDRDQITAQTIAESLDVEFVNHTIDVPTIAAAGKVSIESAARKARYGALAKVAKQRGAYGVVTGHTRDDQAETVLLHAIRGAGLKGISGMKFASILKIPDSNVELNVLRPMLDTPRSDTLEYCDQMGITPAIDSSNSSREYTRNQLRLDVLPLLNKISAGASNALARLTKNAADDLEIVEWIVDRQLGDAQTTTDCYSRSAIAELPTSLATRMLMKAYEIQVGHSQNLERTHVQDMLRHLSGRSGTSIELPNDTVFYIDKDSFGFRSGAEDNCPHPAPLTGISLPLPGTTDLRDGFKINTEIVARPEALDSGDPLITFATPDLITQSLTLRNRRNGDRFQPLGMSPLVKLQDFFVGAGVPERWRDRVPIVESSDKGIIWIAGYRLAEWAKVQPSHGKVARLEISGPRTRS